MDVVCIMLTVRVLHALSRQPDKCNGLFVQLVTGMVMFVYSGV
jgi:hypothetical protein